MLFDELGAPWQVHPCWEEHRREQAEALARIKTELQVAGYDGRFYPPTGTHVRQPVNHERICEVDGHVAEVRHFSADTQRPTGDRSEILVADSVRRLWHFLLPASVAQRIRNYQLVKVGGAWVEQARRWLLVATSVMVVTTEIAESHFVRESVIPGQQGQPSVAGVRVPLHAERDIELLEGWLRQAVDAPEDDVPREGLAQMLLALFERLPVEELTAVLQRLGFRHDLVRLQRVVTGPLKRRFEEAWNRRDARTAGRVLDVLQLAGKKSAAPWIANRRHEIEAYRTLLTTQDPWERWRLMTGLTFLTAKERGELGQTLWESERARLKMLIQEKRLPEALTVYRRLLVVAGIGEELDRCAIELARGFEAQGEGELPRNPTSAATSLEEAVAIYAQLRIKGQNERRREAFLLEGLGEAYEKLGRSREAILCYERMGTETSDPEERKDIVERLARLYATLGLPDRGAEVLEDFSDYDELRVTLTEGPVAKDAHRRWQALLEESRDNEALLRLGMGPIIDDLLAAEHFWLGRG